MCVLVLNASQKATSRPYSTDTSVVAVPGEVNSHHGLEGRLKIPIYESLNEDAVFTVSS